MKEVNDGNPSQEPVRQISQAYLCNVRATECSEYLTQAILVSHNQICRDSQSGAWSPTRVKGVNEGSPSQYPAIQGHQGSSRPGLSVSCESHLEYLAQGILTNHY